MWRPILISLFVLGIIIVAVVTLRIKEENTRNHILLFGNVDVRQVDLGFRVAGTVNKLQFEEGDLVKKGALVAHLDKEPYLDEVEQASGNVAAAKASLQNTKNLLKRRKELINDGIISQEDLDTAQSNFDVAAADLQAAEAAHRIAVTNLKFTEIYAPTKGTILTRTANLAP